MRWERKPTGEEAAQRLVSALKEAGIMRLDHGAPKDERAEFEAWASAQGFNTDRDESDKYREYHRATTRWAWQAWQARAARQVAQQSQARDQLSVNAEGTPASSEPDEQNPASRSSLPNRSVLPREPK